MWAIGLKRPQKGTCHIEIVQYYHSGTFTVVKTLRYRSDMGVPFALCSATCGFVLVTVEIELRNVSKLLEAMVLEARPEFACPITVMSN